MEMLKSLIYEKVKTNNAATLKEIQSQLIAPISDLRLKNALELLVIDGKLKKTEKKGLTPLYSIQ